MKTKLKIIFLPILFLGIFGLAKSSLAADYYIRDGGIGNGSAWNNALDELPVTLVRGNTYYIADGNYPGYIFDDAVSGTSVITVKKATALDHGTNTGWNNSYGDGQAIFQYLTSADKATINIITSYIVFDGAVGSGGDINSYGFRVKYPADGCTASDLWGIGLPATGYSTTTVSNIEIQYTAVEGPGNLPCLESNGGGYYCCNAGVGGNSSNMYNIDIANNYIYGWQTNVTFYRGNNITVHHNYLDSNSNGAYCHGQQMNVDGTSNVSFYSNIFKDSYVFIMGAHGNIGSNTDLKMYNNISVSNQGTQLSGCFANAGTGASNVILGGEFNNNTFVNLNCGGYGAVSVGTITDVNTNKSYAYNNLFYNVANPIMSNGSYTAGAVVHDYNGYLSCTGTINSTIEAHPQRNDSATDPFVDSVNGDYHLTTSSLAVNNGVALDSIYATDYDGVSRPQESAWDMGALEYFSGASDTASPAAPGGLRVN